MTLTKRHAEQGKNNDFDKNIFLLQWWCGMSADFNVVAPRRPGDCRPWGGGGDGDVSGDLAPLNAGQLSNSTAGISQV